MFKNNFITFSKKGVTLVSLVITIVILAIIAGVIVNTTLGDEGVVTEAEKTLREQERKMLIETIAKEIQTTKLKKEMSGEKSFTVQEDIRPILVEYGKYEDLKLKLTTKEGIEIYLYEIMQISMLEYAQIQYNDNKLTITSELLNNGYEIEYTLNNGSAWDEYEEVVNITNSEGIYARIVTKDGKVISNTIKVKEGTMQSDDIVAPIVKIEPSSGKGRTMNVTIDIIEYGQLDESNLYQYYLSTSQFVQENGEWTNYIPGETFTLKPENEGIYYLHIRGVSDKVGNITIDKVVGPYELIKNEGTAAVAPTVTLSVNENTTLSKEQTTVIQIESNNEVMYNYGWSNSSTQAPEQWDASMSKIQNITIDQGQGNYYLWIKDLQDINGNKADTTIVNGIEVNLISGVFAVDNQAPNSFTPTVVTATPTTLTVGASTTDNNGGTVTYFYSINNGSTWLPQNGTTNTQYTFSNLSEGTKYSGIKVKAVDTLGNARITSAISGVTTVTVWNGEFDIGWYVKNTSATSYNIYSPAELAGLALLTANIDTTVYYDANYYANTTSGTYSTTGLDFSGKTINIQNDLNLNNKTWTMGGTFAGTLNGNGHTISGLYLSRADNASLLTTNTGTIKKLIISGATLTSTSGHAGGFAVSNGSTGVIDSCAVLNSNITGYGYDYKYAGGISATNGGLIINSYNAAKVEISYKCTNYFCGRSCVGGISASNGLMVNCYNAGQVVGGCRVGAFVGTQGWQSATPKVLNCYNIGATTGTSSGVGFGVGWIQGGTIQYCYGLSSYSTKPVGGTETTATITNNNNTTFSGSGTTWTLAASVSPNGTATTNLLTALNAWVTANGGAYNGVTLCTWKVDSSKNGGKPILSWQ